MHRVKIFLSSSLFSFYQGMVRTMKMSFFRKKNILSRYTQILVEFPRLMASSSEWTRLKPLLRESSLLTSGFTRIIVYKLIVPWPGSAVGKKWENMEWNGIKRSRGPFSLVPRLPLNSLGSPMFFFSPLNFPPTAEPGPMLNWLLCKILFFLNGFAPISFCTSKTLFPFPSPPWLITFLLPIKINRGHVRHVGSVKFLHVLFSYTRIYITFNSTSPASYFSFTVSLFVCVPSSETAKGKSPHIIDFLKLIVRVVSIVHQNLYLFTCSKYTTKLLFRELSAKNYFLRWLSSNVVLWRA